MPEVSGGSDCADDDGSQLSQIACDAKLYHACLEQGMASKAWDQLAAHTTAQAFRTLCRGLHRREICRWIRDRNPRIRLSIPDDISGHDIEELASESIMPAIRKFKQQMWDGTGWSEADGQTLRAHFLTLCLNEFPNRFREWSRARAQLLPGSPERFERAEEPPEPAAPPANRNGDDVETVMTARQRHAFRLLRQGFSLQQIAELMDITPRAVTSLLKRAIELIARKRKENGS